MKSKIVALTMLGACVMANAQTDQKKLGYKGVVTSVAEGSRHKYIFDGNNNVKSFHYINGLGFTTTKRDASGFVGTYNGYNAVIKTGSGHINSLTIKDGSETYTETYTYNKAGECTKASYSRVWYTADAVEYGLNVDDGGYYDALNDYANSLNQLANSGNILSAGKAAKKAYSSYNKAVNSINKMSVSSYAKTKKTKHTEGYTYVFSNYVYDEVGNWVTRDWSCDGQNGSETNVIEYDAAYLSGQRWKQLESAADLNKIADFYAGKVNASDNDKLRFPIQNAVATSADKEKAAQFWNARILAELEKKGNKVEDLCNVGYAAIATPETKAKALAIAREKVWNENIAKEEDCVKVSNYAQYNVNGNKLFDEKYVLKIQERADALRADSLNKLLAKAEEDMKSNNYSSAKKLSRQALSLDASNQKAAEISSDASYEMLKEKNNSKTLVEQDCLDFLQENPASSHTTDVQNMRSLYASSLFDKSTSTSELERVLAIPDDEATNKIVEKRYKKQMFKNNHGSFFHMGVGFDAGIGTANYSIGGEVAMRFGYFAHFLNVTVAAKYSELGSTYSFTAGKEDVAGAFSRTNISVPVMLRMNLSHTYNTATYLALGAEATVSCLGAKFKNLETKEADVIKIKEKDFANTNVTISPRVALGYSFFMWEIELNLTYDMNDNFNKSFIESYQVNTKNGMVSLPSLAEPKAYDKQVVKPSFIDKCRLGVAARLMF